MGKFSPEIEIVAIPVVGTFACSTYVRTGASYEKGEPGRVPALNDCMSAVATTTSEGADPAPKEWMHKIAVLLVHDEVEQALRSR
jgi:hypothetical protein